VLKKLSQCTSSDSLFTPSEIASAIKELKSGKACGKDSLQSEHLKFACEKIAVLLCLFFNCVLLHGYLCLDLMDTILIPILKDKKGDITSKENYRPIAITTVVSKLFEMVILNRYKHCLQSSHNQFGFKAGHSTDKCTFVLKHVIDYYTSMSSPVFICYLDASKAFDRINFWVLFDKLLSRKVPIIIIRILAFWYTNQQFIVQWGATTSITFKASNGVRQGGVLSPYLFNVYVDGLSNNLNSSGIGCIVNDIFYNHFMYADDAALIAPSASGLQKLIQVCEMYASDCDIIFNTRKTVCMCIKPKCLNKLNVPAIYLNDKKLEFVSSYKYLGILICDSQKDDGDIAKQLRSLYARGNILIKSFSKCSPEVKILLFKTYCTNFYCSHLWQCYRKESLRRLKVAYNRVFCTFLKLDYCISISETFIALNVDHFDIILRKSIVGFNNRISACSNILVSKILRSVYFLRSKMFAGWNSKLYLRSNVW
jgi:hypothetical protein